jgi:uncharacterized membrane protein
MKKVIISVAVSTVVLIALSLIVMYVFFNFFPSLAEEYFSPVFRTAGKLDWMYFVHPLVLSVALKWFWERYKGILHGNLVVRAFEVALVYAVVAMLPVLWLTFSTIDISFNMIITWFTYGFLQSFVAGLVFAKLNP